MKKIIGTLLLYIILLGSCAGFGNKRNQYFVEGDFIGEEIVQDHTFLDDRATLSIKNISKEEFDASNGVDVVKDYNGGQNPYFSICLKVKDEKDEYQDCHFYDLEFRMADYCLYVDKNSNRLVPDYYDSNKGGKVSDYYNISYKITNNDNVTNKQYIFYKNEE